MTDRGMTERLAPVSTSAFNSSHLSGTSGLQTLIRTFSSPMDNLLCVGCLSSYSAGVVTFKSACGKFIPSG